MKKLKYIFPVIALFLFACDSDDDGFYNTVYVQAENMVDVETQDVYQANEVIYVDATIDRLIPEPGFPELLDVRKTTGNAPSFSFSYTLERKNASGEWEFIDNLDDFYVDGGLGSGEVYFFSVTGNLIYDEVEERYEYRGGFTLPSAGEYRLNFSNTTQYSTKAILASNSLNNNIILNIYSSSTDFPTGYHEFTVIN